MSESFIFEELDRIDLIDETVMLLGSCCGNCQWHGIKIDFGEDHAPFEICTANNPSKKFIDRYDTCSNFSRKHCVGK